MCSVTRRQEVQVADEIDTERLAGELLSALRGASSGPVTRAPRARSRAQPAAQMDDRSLLSTIKEYLEQSLPGKKESGAPASAQAAAGGAQLAAEAAYVDWQSMYRRQEQERESMYGRQVRERAEVQQRHVQEMESFAGIRQVVQQPVPARPPLVARPRSTPPASRRYGIVPGKTVGNWTVATDNGPKSFQAVSEDQAFREARRYGLTPTSARLDGIHTYSADELERLRGSIGVPGMRESMEAEFELAIKLGLIPENARFERLPNRDWGYRVDENSEVRKGSELIPKRRY